MIVALRGNSGRGKERNLFFLKHASYAIDLRTMPLSAFRRNKETGLQSERTAVCLCQKLYQQTPI
jgi:hypothetical protein